MSSGSKGGLSRFERSIGEVAAHLEGVRGSFDLIEMDSLARMVLAARRVFVYGAGRSGLVGRMFTQRLMHLELNSYFVGETLTPSLDSRDLLLAISGSGQTVTTLAIAKAARGRKARVVALTAYPDSPLAKEADLVVKVKGKTKLTEYESYAPFTSLFDITCLTYLDSLSSELMGRLDLTDESIKDKHATVE